MESLRPNIASRTANSPEFRLNSAVNPIPERENIRSIKFTLSAGYIFLFSGTHLNHF